MSFKNVTKPKKLFSVGSQILSSLYSPWLHFLRSTENEGVSLIFCARLDEHCEGLLRIILGVARVHNVLFLFRILPIVSQFGRRAEYFTHSNLTCHGFR